ncbi:MAG: hypothetical protein A2189_01470 [Paenibacillus sp. RIFOXYA1_FULL_44_5]|nr:MAG: hypothetical protein A2189_01470 [Paenibacillus sp. RIFOXYA1_FULL_44_5]
MENLISLCMIVKDEEKVLRRCLDSVKNLVDEIIIVDTGSSDHTKSIALEYTDQVFDFTWIHDFSAAKNAAIAKASCKWILVLDADEYVQQQGHEELRSYLKQADTTQPIGILLPIMNFAGETDQDHNKMVQSSAFRLFPNHPDLYYTRAIHEQLTHRSKKLQIISYSFVIFHSGYTVETHTHKKKSERNLKIFEQIKDSGHILSPYDSFTLANEYQSIQDYEQSLLYYRKAYHNANSNDLWLPFCTDRMLQTLFHLNLLQEASMIIDHALKKWHQFSDYYYLKGMLFDHFGLYKEAKQYFISSIEIADKASTQNRPHWLINPNYGRSLPYQKLAEIYYREHDLQQTVTYLTKSLQSDPQNLTVMIKLVNLLIKYDTMEAIEKFLDKLDLKSSSSLDIMLFQVFLFLGHSGVKVYFERCKNYGIAINSDDQMRYSLITGDQLLFEQILRQMENSTKQNNMKSLMLAAVIWGKPAYLETIARNDSVEWLERILLHQHNHTQKESFPESQQVELSFSIASDLFTMGYYDQYDWFISSSSNPNLTNLLADFFYAHSNFELAVDYYSLLLQKDQLGAMGYENLSVLYINQHMKEEALGFLQKAIELNPDKISLYPYFCAHCDDLGLKNAYKNKLIERFPEFAEIPLIQSL